MVLHHPEESTGWISHVDNRKKCP